MIGGQYQQRVDAHFRGVRFESYCELVKLTKEKYGTHPAVTLWYQGYELNGNVELEFSRNMTSIDRNEYLKIAGETLKYF